MSLIGPQNADKIDGYHDALRQIRLSNDDSTHLSQQGYQHTVFGGGTKCSANISNRAVVSLDVELVLHSHWNAMQRAHDSSIFFEELVQLHCSL